MQLTGYGLAPSDLGFDVDGNTFRPNQLELAEALVNSPSKVNLLIGPTGLGKSLIVRIPGRVTDQRTLILTRTIQLQDQYGQQDGLPVLMGRQRYICNRWPEVTAASAVCRAGIKCGLMYSGECDYYREKNNAAQAETAVLNYAVFFRFISSSDIFSGWDWVVLDEAHSTAQELTQAFTFVISIKDLLRFKITPPMKNELSWWVSWAKNSEQRVKHLIKNKEQKVKGSDIEPLYSILSAIEILKLIKNEDEWLIIRSSKEGVIISPIWPNSLAHLGIWSHGQRFILSSATMEPYMIGDMLGVELNDLGIFQVGSDFPIESRPINIVGHHKVSYTSTTEDIDGLVSDIDRIVSNYEGQRGLIHTGNYALSLAIAERSQNGHRLLYHDSENRLKVYTDFRSDDGQDKVLLSPSMIEGVDLPYDLCRFQVIAKIPFEDMTNALWRARFAMDYNRARIAYIGNAISAIVQACGRGMRAADDSCDSWILDRAFDRVRTEANYRFPPFFLEAVRYVNVI